MSDERSQPVNPKWGPLPSSLKEGVKRREKADFIDTMRGRSWTDERKAESYRSHQSSSRGWRK